MMATGAEPGGGKAPAAIDILSIARVDNEHWKLAAAPAAAVR